MVQELDIALRELGRVLTVESIEERFLFYAHIVHQTYWNSLLGGPLIIDDHKAELIPLIKKLINAIKKAEKRANQYKILNLLVLEAEYFIPKLLLLDLVTFFIQESFTSVLRREEVWNNLSADHGLFSPQEKLILALFDLVEPTRHKYLIRACKQLHEYNKSQATNKER